MTPEAYYKGLLKQKPTFLRGYLGSVGTREIFTALHL